MRADGRTNEYGFRAHGSMGAYAIITMAPLHAFDCSPVLTFEQTDTGCVLHRLKYNKRALARRLAAGDMEAMVDEKLAPNRDECRDGFKR